MNINNQKTDKTTDKTENKSSIEKIRSEISGNTAKTEDKSSIEKTDQFFLLLPKR